MTRSFESEALARLHSAAGRIERGIDHLKRVDVEVDARACEYQEAHKDVSYSDALAAVLAADVELAHRYNESFIEHKPGIRKDVSGPSVGSFIHPDPEDEDMSSVAAGKELDRLTLAWLADHPQAKYSDALERVLAAHPDLAALWSKSFNKVTKQTFKEGDGDAGAEIDRLCTAWLKDHPQQPYEKAMGAVRESHPELFKRYEKNAR